MTRCVLCEGFTVSIELVKNKLLSEFEFFFFLIKNGRVLVMQEIIYSAEF